MLIFIPYFRRDILGNILTLNREVLCSYSNKKKLYQDRPNSLGFACKPYVSLRCPVLLWLEKCFIVDLHTVRPLSHRIWTAPCVAFMSLSINDTAPRMWSAFLLHSIRHMVTNYIGQPPDCTSQLLRVEIYTVATYKHLTLLHATHQLLYRNR